MKKVKSGLLERGNVTKRVSLASILVSIVLTGCGADDSEIFVPPPEDEHLQTTPGMSVLERPSSPTATQVTCSSHKYAYESCSMRSPIRWVNLVRQDSKASCIQDVSWGYDKSKGYIWVKDGCRAAFSVLPGPMPEHLPPVVIACSSDHYRHETCTTSGPIVWAELVSQISKAPCNLGDSWDYNQSDGYLTVKYGCRGEFRVYPGEIP